MHHTTPTTDTTDISRSSFTEVLVPVADDVWRDRGAVIAVDLAKRLGLPLRYLHMTEVGQQPVSFEPRRVTQAEPDVVITTTVVDGDDPAAVIRAEQRPGSLVVMSTDHASPWNREPSVATTLALTASVPIVMCGPNVLAKPMTGSVMVPLDGSATAESAIETGVEISSSLGESLWFVQAIDSTTSATVHDLASAGQRVSESAYLQSIAADQSAAWEVLHSDDVVAGLLEFARVHDSGLIVASTHGEGGVHIKAFGSTCLELVESSPLPVLIVRSEHKTRRLGPATF